MRNMTKSEIMDFVKYWTWGTLIAVEDHRPYAIELSYGTDGSFIYCGSRPGGRMARCIMKNPYVAFKICDSDRSYSRWRAVLIEGKAERLTSYEDILYSVRCIARQRGLNEQTFDAIAKRLFLHPESNSLRIPLQNISGIISS